MINIQENELWVEGFLKEGDSKHMNFLVCTLKDILDGGKKWFLNFLFILITIKCYIWLYYIRIV